MIDLDNGTTALCKEATVVKVFPALNTVKLALKAGGRVRPRISPMLWLDWRGDEFPISEINLGNQEPR
eukprot:7861157-Prorocentrum_lima.AAC.1